MALFSKKIVCTKCKKFHKFKKQRSKSFYIDSTYDNKGKSHCDRLPVEESLLIGLIEMRIGKIPNEEDVKELIDVIEVSPDELIINFYKGDPIILRDRFLQIHV